MYRQVASYTEHRRASRLLPATIATVCDGTRRRNGGRHVRTHRGGGADHSSLERQSFVHLWTRITAVASRVTMVFQPPSRVKTVHARGVSTTVSNEPTISKFNLWSRAAIPPESVTGANAPDAMEIAADWLESMHECYSTYPEDEV